MGSELVGSLPLSPKETPTFERIFWDAYPAYLNMGMSADEYWNGDAESCVAYRRAYEERLKLEDAMLWRQGLYFYQALCRVVPALQLLKPKEPLDYLDKPFGFKKEEPEEEQVIDKGFAYMKAWADSFNARRKQKNGNQRSSDR